MKLSKLIENTLVNQKLSQSSAARKEFTSRLTISKIVNDKYFKSEFKLSNMVKRGLERTFNNTLIELGPDNYEWKKRIKISTSSEAIKIESVTFFGRNDNSIIIIPDVEDGLIRLIAINGIGGTKKTPDTCISFDLECGDKRVVDKKNSLREFIIALEEMEKNLLNYDPKKG